MSGLAVLMLTACATEPAGVVGRGYDGAPPGSAAEHEPSGSTRPGELGTDELALDLPTGWHARPSEVDGLVLLADHPEHEHGRLGVFRVEGLNDVGLYVADTSTIGAALRGLEPEPIRDEAVEVDGAREAQLLEFLYTSPVPGRPRLHSLQLVVRRHDDLGFDVRVELPEGSWEPEVADEVVRSVRLVEPPR